MKTLQITSWGKSGIGPFGVRVGENDFIEDVIAKSVARRTGLSVVTMRMDGTSLNKGRPESLHYQITLGRALRTGGYSVEGEMWIAVPILERKMSTFKPTHTIVIGGNEIPVLNDEGVLYTEGEWEAAEKADWILEDSGELSCVGVAKPGAKLVAIKE